MKGAWSLNVLACSLRGKSSGSNLPRSSGAMPRSRGSWLYVGNVLDLTIWRRGGAVVFGIGASKGEKGLLFGPVEFDHVLPGDMASSERTSSLVALAFRRESNGSLSSSYALIAGVALYGIDTLPLLAGAEYCGTLNISWVSRIGYEEGLRTFLRGQEHF